MIQDIIKVWDKYGYVFLQGLWGTLWLSAVSVAVATLIGAILAIMKLSKFKPFQWVVDVYISIIRGTPVLLQLYFFWLWLGNLLPWLTDTGSIVVALIVNASAYVAEVIRAGIQAVDIGQREAAKSLGMTDYQTMMRVIMPQAIKNILPALGNQYIMMVKQTSLASIFYINDIMTSYRMVMTATYKPMPALIIAGIIYMILTTVMTKGLSLFERRLQKSERR